MHVARKILICSGVIIPVVETIRRWNTWREFPPSMFDDYVIGALMIWVGWVTRREQPRDRTYLATAIGFALGVLAMSTLASAHDAQRALRDPSGLAASTVATIKGGLLVCGGVFLARVLRKA